MITESITSYLKIEGLVKQYGSLDVLRGINLAVAPQQALVMMGPSGCGKSTLLRCINGLEPFQSGSITVSGRDVGGASAKDLKAIRFSTGFVFQSFNLFPHMTVLQNLILAPQKLLKKSRKEALDIAFDLLDRVGISDKANVYPCSLSGGQRQRAAIARALAMQPRLMLFDEPTSALDPEMREEVLCVIRSLRDHEKMTMVIVTHEIGFARDVADYAVLMESGQIVDQGPAREFFLHPKTERSQKFLRSIANS